MSTEYKGPAKTGADLKGDLFTSYDEKCPKHPQVLLREFNVGPAWEFYFCPSCEENETR